MDAVEFFKIKNYLCERECNKCPLSYEHNGYGCSCQQYTEDYPEKAVTVIEKWWKENKPMTNAEWVKKKLEEIGYSVELRELKSKCPVRLDCTFTTKSFVCNATCCSKCKKWWDEEHKEVEE